MRQYAADTGNVAQRDEAIALADSAEKIYGALHEQNPDGVDYEAGLAEVYALMSSQHYWEGNHKDTK